MKDKIIGLENIFNDYTLNIFCDASTTGGEKTKTKLVCSGTIGIVKDQMIDSNYRISQGTTSSNGEARALLNGIHMALKYKDMYSVINIFSDSQISVFGIREWMKNWKCVNGVFYTKSTNEPVASQELFYEMYLLFKTFELKANLFSQKGHVNVSNFNQLQNAKTHFKRFNHIPDEIEVKDDFVAYISNFNDIVDRESRNRLYMSNTKDLIAITPYKFIPEENFKYEQF